MFVGVNYNEKDKTHECRIERFTKEQQTMRVAFKGCKAKK